VANDAAADAPALAVTRVDDDGLLLAGDTDVVVDVLFDDRRIWSFWSVRDTEPTQGGRTVEWPSRLRRFLDGTTRLTVRTHVDGAVLFDEERRFGTADERIAVVNAQGQPLGMDKSGRLQVTFETRTAEDFVPLLDAIEEVLDALHRAGVEAFPAYGTLLGAVRQGGFIGHDSDADLGYVSRRTAPVDVIRESYALQRRLAEMGYQVSRYSGAGFAVRIEERDGGSRTLDVFGGFLSDGHLIVLGEVRVPFRVEWVYPLGTTTLEGRTLPAPADPERFLTATYGPDWRVPDPAFAFTTPPSTSRRLDDWFRGIVENRSDWDARYQQRLQRIARRGGEVDPQPNRLASFLDRREEKDGVVVDLGCGYGHNSIWLAEQGRQVEALDYSYRSFHTLDLYAQERGLPVAFAPMNLLETRHVLAHGARIARLPGPHVVLARHLVDALPERGLENAWRFLAMVLRGGGRLYAEFLTRAGEDDSFATTNLLTPIEADVVVAELERIGGRVVEIEETRAGARPDDEDEVARMRRGCRMVVEWPA
jgi:SAM-dependent methyltransferase